MSVQEDLINKDFVNKKEYNENNLVDNQTNSDSDDTYIDINDLLKEQLKSIYQIQINNESLIIKHIGMGSHVPDMIIKEGFGKNNNLNLYNCVYMESEIDFLKTELNNNKFLPIVKLVEKLESNNKIYTLSIKINDLLNFNASCTNFNLYLTYPLENDYINYIEIEKTINSSNIIEKMLESARGPDYTVKKVWDPYVKEIYQMIEKSRRDKRLSCQST